MNRKIPPDAFAYYFSLGPGRSYQAVAEKYGVSKRAVTLLAARENWQARLAEQEQKARESANQKVLESLEEMDSRHLKTARFLQSKGIEALKGMPLDNATAAVRAIVAGLEKERLIRGEPTERTENVEALIKREYATLFKPVGQEDWPEAEAETEPGVNDRQPDDEDTER
ncbi:MAG TPA: hypothetical protein VMS76_02020 [Planctomycetota bacterium]|nr:hypothetical protein [Planctomycetota bacterium]